MCTHIYMYTHTHIHSLTNTFNLSLSFTGKSGLVGERFASSLSSVGIISHYVHACEWVHGDLG